LYKKNILPLFRNRPALQLTKGVSESTQKDFFSVWFWPRPNVIHLEDVDIPR
jgi:hypothetical protein